MGTLSLIDPCVTCWDPDCDGRCGEAAYRCHGDQGRRLLAPTEVAHGKHILLVDDDSNLLDSVWRTLRQRHRDWSLTITPRGTEAMKIAREGLVDLLITDILMPDTDGWEIIRKLRQDDPSMKIIAISGLVDPNVLGMARSLGAHCTLEKPFLTEELIDSVETLLDG